MTLLRLITTTSKGTHCSFERLPIYVNVLMLGSVNIALSYLILNSVLSFTLFQINILFKCCPGTEETLGYYHEKYE